MRKQEFKRHQSNNFFIFYRIQSCIQALSLDPSYAVIYLGIHNVTSIHLLISIDSSSNFDIERFSQIYRAQEWAHRIPISDFMARIFPIPFGDVYELITTLYVLPKIISELATLDNFVKENVCNGSTIFTLFM